MIRKLDLFNEYYINITLTLHFYLRFSPYHLTLFSVWIWIWQIQLYNHLPRSVKTLLRDFKHSLRWQKKILSRFVYKTNFSYLFLFVLKYLFTYLVNYSNVLIKWKQIYYIVLFTSISWILGKISNIKVSGSWFGWSRHNHTTFHCCFKWSYTHVGCFFSDINYNTLIIIFFRRTLKRTFLYSY